MFLLLPGLNAKRSTHEISSSFIPSHQWSTNASGVSLIFLASKAMLEGGIALLCGSAHCWQRNCRVLWAEQSAVGIREWVPCLIAEQARSRGEGVLSPCFVSGCWGAEFKQVVKCLQHWGSRFSAFLCSQSFLSLNDNCFEVKMLLVLASRSVGMKSFWLPLSSIWEGDRI